MKKTIQYNTEHYLSHAGPVLTACSNETRKSYLKVLCLIFTVNITLLVGSLSCVKELELLKTPMTSILTYIGWILCGVATLILALSLVKFLIELTCTYDRMLLGWKNALKAKRNNQENFEQEDPSLLMKGLILSATGFLFFIFGTLNLLLALIAQHWHVCVAVAVLINLGLGLSCLFIFYPLFPINKKVSDILE